MKASASFPEKQLGEREPKAWSLDWCGEGLGDCPSEDRVEAQSE